MIFVCNELLGGRGQGEVVEPSLGRFREQLRIGRGAAEPLVRQPEDNRLEPPQLRRLGVPSILLHLKYTRDLIYVEAIYASAKDVFQEMQGGKRKRIGRTQGRQVNPGDALPNPASPEFFRSRCRDLLRLVVPKAEVQLDGDGQP